MQQPQDSFDPTGLSSLSVDAITQRLAGIEAEKATKKKGGKIAQRIEESDARKGGKSKPVETNMWATSAAVDKEADKKQKETQKKQEQANEEAEKTQLLDQIEAYRARFKHLKKRNKCENMKASISELRDEVHYIEGQLGGSSSKDGGKEPVGMLFVGAMYGLEYGSREFNPLGLNLTGLGSTAQMNINTFQDTLDEMAIKYGLKMNVGVEVRLAVMVSTMVLTVHESNNGGGPISHAMNQLQKAQEAAGKPAPAVDKSL